MSRDTARLPGAIRILSPRNVLDEFTLLFMKGRMYTSLTHTIKDTVVAAIDSSNEQLRANGCVLSRYCCLDLL